MKLSDSKNKLTCFVIMTLFPFYKNMLQFSGWSCSYKNGALLAKFQPGVLNPFVLICGCLLYFLTWFQLAYLTNYSQVSFQGSESKHILLWGNNLWEWLTVGGGEMYVRMYFSDFFKGFDLVDHNVLLRELDNPDVDPHLVRRIAAFLTNRNQRVRVGELCPTHMAD